MPATFTYARYAGSIRPTEIAWAKSGNQLTVVQPVFSPIPGEGRMFREHYRTEVSGKQVKRLNRAYSISPRERLITDKHVRRIMGDAYPHQAVRAIKDGRTGEF